MTIVLDTAALPEGDRADALREAMRMAGVVAKVMPFQTATVEAKMNVWQLDAGITLMHRVGTGLWLERTHRQAQIAAETKSR